MIHTTTQQVTHYTSPKLTVRHNPAKGNFGLFASATIEPGELLVVWGGDIVNYEQLITLPTVQQQHSVQVEEGLYLVTVKQPDAGDYINHSCEPNAGLSGQIAVVAMRDIYPGEEVCYDYAMSDGSPYDLFDCGCGSSYCRKHISGNDWQYPELQMRYAGYFSPYLQRRIDQMRHGLTQRELIYHSAGSLSDERETLLQKSEQSSSASLN